MPIFRFSLLLPVLLPVLLMACVPEAPSQTPPQILPPKSTPAQPAPISPREPAGKHVPVMVLPEASCGAEEMQGLVGKSAKVLETMRFAHTVRILRPGMAVTMDYSAERLNIEVNEAEVIKRVSCG